MTVTESRIEEVELEMARLTQGADTDANVTEQGELERLRQEYVDLQHQRDALNEQIVHARTVLTADEAFDYDTDYGSESPTSEIDLNDLEFRDWLKENHSDLSQHIDADGNLWSDPTASGTSDGPDPSATRLAQLREEFDAAREEYQESQSPTDNDATSAPPLPSAEEAQQADNPDDVGEESMNPWGATDNDAEHTAPLPTAEDVQNADNPDDVGEESMNPWASEAIMYLKAA